MKHQFKSIGFITRQTDVVKEFLIKRISKDNNYDLSIIQYEELLEPRTSLTILSEQSYDIIMLPLSLPNYFSLKLVEKAHLLNSECRLMLYSGTHAPKYILLQMFDGFISDFINPKEFKNEVRKMSENKLLRIKEKDQLEGAIAAILATASCFNKGSLEPGSHHSTQSNLDDYKEGLQYEDKQWDEKYYDEEGGYFRPPISLFYSYCHDDEPFKEELEKHLSLLKRQGYIEAWSDRKISAGDEWKGAISKNLSEARIILLLISSSFLASDYCYDIEMRIALTKHEEKNAKVIPIIIRPVDWQQAPFSKLQALPKNAKPVSTWTSIDEAWTNVAVEVRKIATLLRG